MSRFALAVLALIVLAVSPALAQPTTALAGVRTVYLNVDDLSTRRDIARALKAELPQVKVVWRLSDADAVLSLRGNVERIGGAETTNGRVATTDVSLDIGNQQRVITVPLGQPTHSPGRVEGIVVVGSQAIVLHQGLPTPAFPNQFAARFIRAWREANP